MEDIAKIGHFDFEGIDVIRTITLKDGRVLFLAYDVIHKILGVVNPHNLTKSVDERSKVVKVMSFEEDVNPQRYIFIDLDGLMCVTYKARKSNVDRLDFINWAKEIG